jgi:hypothetical protein
VVEQDEVFAEPVQGVHYRRIDVDDRRDDTVRDGIERTDFLYLGRIKTLVDEVVNHLAVLGEDSQFGAAVSLVDTQIHGDSGGVKKKKVHPLRMDFYSLNRLIT